MNEPILVAKGISKQLRLGAVGYNHLHKDLGRWMARLLGRPDPNSKLDVQNRKKSEASDTPSGPTINSAVSAPNLFWALKDVSFELRPGDVLAFIGRNGAGKSTLLKILARITAPTEGAVKYQGRLASMLEIGTGFHPELSGRDNIYLNGLILGMSEEELTAKFDQIVEFSEIGSFLDTPVKRYSSGMYVKLAFSVAAFLDPDILLIDEVLAVGDVAFQEKCMGKMDSLARDGKAVIFVSHNIGSIQKLCNRAILLHHGKILADGEVTPVIREYLKMMRPESEDLKTRQDREGNGEIQFTDVWFETDAADRVRSVMSGDSVKIWVAFENKSVEARQVHIIITITTVFHQPVTDFTYRCKDEEFIEPGARKRILIELNRFALNTGSFYLNLMARALNTDIMDFVEQAITFNVVPGKFFTDGRSATAEYCLISHDHNIQLLENNPC